MGQRRGWMRWRDRTCSWCRWTGGVSGIATTTCFASCCWPSWPVATPQRSARLHQRAADWFEQRAMYEDALEHTALTGTEAALADLLLKHHFELFRTGTVDTFMRWLPRRSRRRAGRAAGVDRGWCPGVGDAGPAGSDSQALRRACRGRVEAARREPLRIYVQTVAALTRGGLLDGDLDVALEEIRIAADLARTHVPLLVVGALGVLSYVEYLAGDEAAAGEAAAEALARPEAVGAPPRPGVCARGARAAGVRRWSHESAAVEARVAVGYARELGLAGTWSAGDCPSRPGRGADGAGQAGRRRARVGAGA